MKERSQLRNIGIIAHIDAGKTTFSERILFYSDVIHRMGEVHEGAATMDFMPEEQERGITIASACVTCMWRDHAVNLVDTPGHVDFTIEVERCLRVLDAAVGIFCGVGGVEPQSETVWRQADAFGIPRLAVINKMDRPGASFKAALEAMRVKLGANPVAVTIPLGEGEEFEAIIDLVSMQRLDFDESVQGKEIHARDLDEKEAALAAPWRDELMDALTMEDDELLDLCLGGENPPRQMLLHALRKGTLSRSFVPVYAASALRNIGVQPVLDGVCDFLPSPLDVPPAKAHDAQSGKEVIIPADVAAPVCALAFKVLMAGGRKTVFVRLYAGTLKAGDMLTNSGNGKKERAMRIYRLLADRRENLEEAFAGDIVAVQGFKDANTGDTMVGGGKPVLLEPIRSWKPVISLAFEPRNSEEGERLDLALTTFAAEDPTLAVETSESTGERLVSGMGELHLEVLADRLRREWSLEPRIGNPQVVCRETIRATAQGTGEFDRELGGQTHYGQVQLEVAPSPRSGGTGISFSSEILPDEWHVALLDAVKQGVGDAFWTGPLGYTVEDVTVTILQLERKNGLATVPGMHMAAQHALRQALEKAKPVLLEPLMRLDISVPDAFLGPVMSLLGTCGAKVESLDDRAGQKQVQAVAPMRGLFGFATSLRSVSQGRAGLMMQFLRFDVIE